MTKPHRERRAHRRVALRCPTVVTDADGRELLRSHTADVSDGGLRLQGDGHSFQAGQRVHLAFRLPRKTDNTFMYEDAAGDAWVVRCQPVGRDGAAAVAFVFVRPMELALEA